MRRITAILLPIALVAFLLSLTMLPLSYAQPVINGTAQYLPAVFKAANTPTPTVTRTPSQTPTAIRTVTLTPTAQTTNPLYTFGQDIYNCSDFSTWARANAVYQANLIDGDPNRLDQDGDGIPCESLPGAP